MAKVSLKAGAEFDVLTRRELAQELDRLSAEWMAEVTRGFKYRRFLGVGTIAGGAVTVQDSTDNVLGPGAGMVWAVNAVTIGGLAVNDSVDLFINGDPVCSFVRTATTGQYVTRTWGLTELVLNPNDALVLSGSGLTATGNIALYGRCTELSRLLSYKLV